MIEQLDLLTRHEPKGQVALIVEHCRRGWLTDMDALMLFRCRRLAARIHDAERKYGYRFDREWRTGENGSRYLAYRLVA